MLDREAVEEFLESELEYLELEIPHDVPKSALVDAFCEYIADGYYEWLRENFTSFFNDGDPDWDWIKEQISTNEE